MPGSYAAHTAIGYPLPTQQPITHQPLLSLSNDQMQLLLQMLEPTPPGNEALVGKPPAWLIDSGALHHMIGNLSLFFSTHDISLTPVGLLDGLQTMATRSGTVALTTGIFVRDVLYVPKLAVNLISVSRLTTDADCFVVFSPDICVLQDRTMKSPIGLGRLIRGVFVFQSVLAASTAVTSVNGSYDLWHQ